MSIAPVSRGPWCSVERPSTLRPSRDDTILVHNADGGMPNIGRLLGRTSAANVGTIVILNLGASRRTSGAVRAWTQDTQAQLLRSEAPLVTFNGDVALANRMPLPRGAGLTEVVRGVHLVTRRWVMRGADGSPRLLLIGPSAEPHLPDFLGSLWSQDLLSEDDIGDCDPAPGVIGDFDYQGPIRSHSTYVAATGSPWRTAASLPQRLLDQVRPRVVWCRSTVTDSATGSRVRAVRAGRSTEIDLGTLVDPPPADEDPRHDVA